ncbi:transposase [Streptomyces sp. NPDC088748]|uniref:transposase n=1 Tax=Streptomyces sp. NPDC088748 TaxID=3365887 RepID=UPI003818A791
MERWQQAGVFDRLHRILLAELNAVGQLDWSRRAWTAAISGRKKGGSRHRSVAGRPAEEGSKHHLICDGRGTPLRGVTTAANVNDITGTFAPVDGIPPVAGRPGRPRRRPDALLGDTVYDSSSNRDELDKGRILPVISCKAAQDIKGMVKLRYVVEQTFRPASSVQTTRRPLGTPHRTPRRLHLPRQQPHLPATPQQAQPIILLRARGISPRDSLADK